MNKSNKTNVSPLTKMTITPLFFEQIEKFQCLKVSTTQGLAPGTPQITRGHVSRAWKRASKLLNFEGLYLKKPDLFDLADTSPWLRDDHWVLGHVSHPGANYVTKPNVTDSCV